jgi:hypothetical protein
MIGIAQVRPEAADARKVSSIIAKRSFLNGLPTSSPPEAAS